MAALTVGLVAACTSSPAVDASGGPTDTSPAAGAASTSGTPGSTADPTQVRVAGARSSPGCNRDLLAPARTAGVVEHRTIDMAGTGRTYDIAFPAPPAAVDVPAPLVLSFHGFSGDSTRYEAATGIAAEGTSRGAVVVLPNGKGTPPTWEITGTGPDGAFVDRIIEEIGASACIDLDRVHMTGLSAGSAFAIAYTCARHEQIAAIGAVTVEFVLGCTKPTSIIAFHGTRDESVPYQDGALGKSLPGIPVRGTELNMGDWAKLGGCGEPAKTAVSETVTHWVFERCHPGTEVELFSIEGGPHVWPRAAAPSPGAPAGGLDATHEILAFLARQHR